MALREEAHIPLEILAIDGIYLCCPCGQKLCKKRDRNKIKDKFTSCPACGREIDWSDHYEY